MGKREVRLVTVPKWATIVVLLVVSAAMAGIVFYLSGKAYTRGDEPWRDLAMRILQRRGPLSRNAMIASLAPFVANILFFLPWGFVMFMAIDRPGRSRAVTYLLTAAAGAMFALGLIAWQTVLPTQVTGVPDAVANAIGAFTGALAGHLRKGVRVQFDY